MRTRSRHKKEVKVVTLGCSKNLVDSEVIMGQLSANHFDIIPESEKQHPEVVIINTCGFIANAKQQSVDTILEYARIKKKGHIKRLIVTGCLSERYKPELQNEIPEVDHYFGTNDLPALLKTVGANYKSELIGERLLNTPQHYAYLKISEGCDRPCSFCAIPLMRGKHKSKNIENLVVEATQLAAKGVKELILIAQDSTYYGLDLYKKRRLHDLISALEQVDGIEWIRLHYAYPAGFPLEVLDVMSASKKVCNYIDIPLQHISNDILKSMRRGTTQENTMKLINEMRSRVEGIAIRTTLISGYPGETKEHHQELLRFVEEAQFDRLGVFTYSHEENTGAYALDDNVPDKVKTERADEIMMLQQSISEQKNQLLIGRNLKVLIDRKDGDYFVGRTEYDSPEVDNEVLISSKDYYCSVGSFVEVAITDAAEFDLFAEPFSK
ncbi:MAG TPA: 30S ribosomal protein S12 methylthiotransferase RimO [Bacteroidia bacterium]|nr:30S ribosomal protein S12 methylthiotransferase RimO [Bacteroidia bacterium]HNT80330.1 30S ribosomal protein S12 methylthiotransferase RimO [Bacteroidia bacterium]